jgi:hypothetical protein
MMMAPLIRMKQPAPAATPRAPTPPSGVLRRPVSPQMAAILQRKCACGARAPTGTCASCAGETRAVQRKQAEPPAGPAPLSGSGANHTGMPNQLKAGLEALSGLSLADVRVHRDSPKPARIQAHAYTYGTDIFLGPGQQHHLAHEGWHVVQQMQSRVAPTEALCGLALNDDAGLEREADTFGARAESVGRQIGTTAFATKLARADGSFDEEPFTAGMPSHVRPAAPPSGSFHGVGQARRIIQRLARFDAGTVSRTTNLAAHLIAGNRTAGFTPPTLNGTTCMTAGAAQGAIHAPTLGSRANADGTFSKWVATVPTNVGSFTMQLPSGARWATTTTKANVSALFTSLGGAVPVGCGTAGNSVFRVMGRPTDVQFAANVTTHENLHAADHRAGFTAVIGAWDTLLGAARTARTLYNGASAANAEAALYAAMGGTPAQIAANQMADWVTRNAATHTGATLATGGNATPSNFTANATCTTSSLDAT